MARFRDVKSVTLLGSAITGVQRIGVRGGATRIDYSGDDDAGLQDIGVTKRLFNITVEVKDSTKSRDIKDPQFTDKAGTPVVTALNEVQNVEIALQGNALPDSAEDDTWLTYIGVTDVQAAVDVALRDVDQVFGAIFPIGIRGKVDFDVQAPMSTEGLPDGSSLTDILIDNLVLIGVDTGHSHKELNEGTLRFGGHGTGGAAPLIAGSVLTKTTGDEGSLVFTAVSATGGADKVVTIVNCVVIGVRARFEHGGIWTATYELQAYSADGDASPLSVV